MKTAMQELIDEFRHLCYDKDFHLGLNGIKVTQEIIDGLEKKYLEKEKEQIIDAGNACSIKTIVHREKLDEMSKDELRDSLVEDTISYGQEYYNQTYNQNK
jgi:predicted nuclease of restriction endonuclease-like RecB superfamily